jgi:hypothetical protein
MIFESTGSRTKKMQLIFVINLIVYHYINEMEITQSRGKFVVLAFYLGKIRK